MNLKIRELAERAGDDWDHTLESDRQFLQKFAQLIIEECAKVCEAGITHAQDWDASYWDQACENRANTIRAMKTDHFGVEE